MNLRFVEREIVTPIYGSDPAIGKFEKVKVLQIGVQGESCMVWSDVPLGIEEKTIEALRETK